VYKAAGKADQALAHVYTAPLYRAARTLFVKKKALRTGALITAGSVFCSVTPIWIWLQIDPVIDTASIYLSSIILPLLIAPTCSFFILRSQLRAERLAAENYRLANVDDLTGLPNRRSFFAGAECLLREASAGGGRFFCGIADVDDFKRINDAYGHGIGDRVLVDVAAAMQAAHSRGGLIARLGGEEFAMAGVFLDETEARQACLALVQAVAGLSCFEEPVTISLGYAGESSGETLPMLMNQADKALYLAKQGGKNRVHGHPGHQTRP